MIDQIFITYYVFAFIGVLGLLLYSDTYGEKNWVPVVGGMAVLITIVLAVVHLLYYIWR
jgi:hypothetical protein